MYFGSEDPHKKFNDDVANLLQSHKEDIINNPVLSEKQIAAANVAKEALAEKNMYTVETRNSVLKKHLFESSKGIKVTSAMVSAFSAIALGD